LGRGQAIVRRKKTGGGSAGRSDRASGSKQAQQKVPKKHRGGGVREKKRVRCPRQQFVSHRKEKGRK